MQTTQITVRRPDGTVEIVTKAGALGEAMRYQMARATEAAGRGEIIGWEHVIAQAPRPVERRYAGGYTRRDIEMHEGMETGSWWTAKAEIEAEDAADARAIADLHRGESELARRVREGTD